MYRHIESFVINIVLRVNLGFPGGSGGKRINMGSIPGLGRSPGEGKVTHSSLLAWRIPWTEEPGGLQSMESQSQTRLSEFAFAIVSYIDELVKIL